MSMSILKLQLLEELNKEGLRADVDGGMLINTDILSFPFSKSFASHDNNL